MSGERRIRSAVVTGPTGAIGTALCALLAQKGVAVSAIVRPGSPRTVHLLELDGVDVVECDVSELNSLPALVGKADAFFHLAWVKTTGNGRNDMLAQVDNVRYTLNACHVAKELGCALFIGAGSQAEYGRYDRALTPQIPPFPENGYGMAKLCAGQMSRVECKAFGIDHIWPRILSVYGPYDGAGSMVSSTIRALLAGEKPALTAGEQLWDYLYADDAAAALWLMALRGRSGAVYPLGSGEARPLREYIEVLRDAIDPTLPLGFGEDRYADDQVMHLEADISMLKADTGFEPKVDFVSGIRRTIEYVRRNARLGPTGFDR